MKLNTVTIGKTNTIIVIITNAKKKNKTKQRWKRETPKIRVEFLIQWIGKSFKPLRSRERSKRKFSAVFRNLQAERWLEKGVIFLNLAVQSSKLQLHLNYRDNAHLRRLPRLGNATRKRLQSSLNFFPWKLNSVLHFIFIIKIIKHF